MQASGRSDNRSDLGYQGQPACAARRLGTKSQLILEARTDSHAACHGTTRRSIRELSGLADRSFRVQQSAAGCQTVQPGAAVRQQSRDIRGIDHGSGGVPIDTNRAASARKPRNQRASTICGGCWVRTNVG